MSGEVLVPWLLNGLQTPNRRWFSLERNMTTDQIHIIAQALFGPYWCEPLADALGINLRTVQRWKTGDREPPDLRGDLVELCERRGLALLEIAAALK